MLEKIKEFFFGKKNIEPKTDNEQYTDTPRLSGVDRCTYIISPSNIYTNTYTNSDMTVDGFTNRNEQYTNRNEQYTNVDTVWEYAENCFCPDCIAFRLNLEESKGIYKEQVIDNLAKTKSDIKTVGLVTNVDEGKLVNTNSKVTSSKRKKIQIKGKNMISNKGGKSKAPAKKVAVKKGAKKQPAVKGTKKPYYPDPLDVTSSFPTKNRVK